jgi:type II secretory pathway component PulJ
MVVVSILSVGAFVAFFFYHRYIITKIEYSLLNLEAEIDYMEEVVQTMRLHISEMELAQIRRSQVKRTAKKRGRPVNPDSIRQKKMKGGK